MSDAANRDRPWPSVVPNPASSLPAAVRKLNESSPRQDGEGQMQMATGRVTESVRHRPSPAVPALAQGRGAETAPGNHHAIGGRKMLQL